MNAKWFGLTLALAAPLVYVYPGIALEDETAVEANVAVVAELGSDGEAGEPAIVVVGLKTEGDGGDGRQVICQLAGANAPNATFCSKRGPRGAPLGLKADPNRGWLGVQLAEVPPALAAQLPAAENAAMIHNVVNDSPADDAGLEKFDIIAKLNGESVSDGVGGLARAIGALAPGAEVSLTILRGGREITVNATLSSRPASGGLHWIHEFAPEAVYRELFNTRGKILSKDEDGNWRLEDLGDIEDLEDLPEELRSMLPGAAEITIKVFVDEDRKTISTIVVRDGETLAIEQEDGGEIVVQRTDRDGDETEATYADADALAAGDEDAYEIYQQAIGGANIEIHIGPDDDDVTCLPGAHGLFLQGQKEEWREQLQSAMKEAQEAMEQARRSMGDARRKMKLRLRGLPGRPFFFWDSDDFSSAFGGAAALEFRVNPDGEIEVMIRKDDTEVTKVFRDEADLQQRDPKLYEEYTETTSQE